MTTALSTTVQSRKSELAAALPALMRKDSDRFLAFVVAAVENPAIANCNQESVMASIVKSAQWGLLPDGVHAALVPYGPQCTFIPMYRGLIAAYRRGGEIKQVWADVVFKGDQFNYERGSNPKLSHTPGESDRTDPLQVTHAYACARWADGHVDFEVMTRGELDRIKGRARSQSGPWKTDTIAMYLKCPIRRMARILPLSEDIQQLVSEEERMEAVEYENVTGPPRTLDAIVEREAAKAPAAPQDASAEPVLVSTYSGIHCVLGAPWEEWKDSKIGGANRTLAGLSWQDIATTDDQAVLAVVGKALEAGRKQQAERDDQPPDIRFQRLAMAWAARERALLNSEAGATM